MVPALLSGIFSPLNTLIEGAYAKSLQKRGYEYQKELLEEQKEKELALLQKQKELEAERRKTLLVSMLGREKNKRESSGAILLLIVFIIIIIVVWAFWQK